MLWRKSSRDRENKSTLRFGVIGCGKVVEELHLPAWQTVKEAQLVAICDSSPSRLGAIAQYCPSVARYKCPEELIDVARNLDFVVLATPGITHVDIAEQIIKRGLHLLCEKPLALRLADAEHLYNLAEKFNVVLTPIHNYRYKTNTQRALDTAKRHKLGDIVAVNVSYRSGPLFDDPTPWRRRERENHILLFDIAIHFVDIATLFLGPLERLCCVDAVSDNLGLQRVVFTTLHKSGSRGLFELMVDASSCQTEIEILGERLSMAIQFFPEGCRILPLRESPFYRGLADGKRILHYARQNLRTLRADRRRSKARSHAELFRRFVGAVRKVESNPVPKADVLETIGLLESVAIRAYGESDDCEKLSVPATV